jgi:hypothetical protein
MNTPKINISKPSPSADNSPESRETMKIPSTISTAPIINRKLVSFSLKFFTLTEKGWKVTPYLRLPVLWASLDALP